MPANRQVKIIWADGDLDTAHEVEALLAGKDVKFIISQDMQAAIGDIVMAPAGSVVIAGFYDSMHFDHGVLMQNAKLSGAKIICPNKWLASAAITMTKADITVSGLSSEEMARAIIDVLQL